MNEGNSTVGPGSPKTMYAILESNVQIAHEGSLRGVFAESTKSLIASWSADQGYELAKENSGS